MLTGTDARAAGEAGDAVECVDHPVPGLEVRRDDRIRPVANRQMLRLEYRPAHVVNVR